MQRTCWQGIALDHPCDWELAAVAGDRRAGRCSFMDRRAERLVLQWRTIDYVPNLDLILDKYRQDADGAADCRVARDLPRGWRGVLKQFDEGWVLHAGRFHSEGRRLVEATVVWPRDRDEELESRVLSSIADGRPGIGEDDWIAMGIHLGLPGDYQLESASTHVGRIRWEFRSETGVSPLTVERIAMPQYWLHVSLSEWLKAQLPEDVEILDAHGVDVNGHHAERIITRRTTKIRGRMRRTRRCHADLAWRCPVEERVYRLGYAPVAEQSQGALPEGVHIQCCIPSSCTPAAGRHGRSDLLESVPHPNRAMQVEPRTDGGAVVAIPLKRPRYLVPPISWVLPFSSQRRAQLDALGATVLELCDGGRTVEQIVECVATQYRLSFREALLSVTPFMRLLTERGMLAVIGSDGGGQP